MAQFYIWGYPSWGLGLGFEIPTFGDEIEPLHHH